jgi:hypothetical protein
MIIVFDDLEESLVLVADGGEEPVVAVLVLHQKTVLLISVLLSVDVRPSPVDFQYVLVTAVLYYLQFQFVYLIH